MRVFNLDACEDEGTDIQVFIPGPPGPPIVDVGSFSEPIVITSTIAAPSFRRQRTFIIAASDIDQPAIPNPVDDGPWEFIIQVVGTHSITLNDASNIKLSGEWFATADSIMSILWDGNSRYVEQYRNEI